jgi:hypothetical protein
MDAARLRRRDASTSCRTIRQRVQLPRPLRCRRRILADLPEVDVLVAGLGTGSTIMGASRRLKARPGIAGRVEPPEPSQVRLHGSTTATFPILDLDLLDGRSDPYSSPSSAS